MEFLFNIFTFCLVAAIAYVTEETDLKSNPVVKTLHGSVKGIELKSRAGNPYYGFRGIPYANYPGRFQVAKDHATWDGVLDATEFGSICAQLDLFDPNGTFLGAEDCLFLNIYTPTLDPNANLPVLFFIHPGSFTSWSGNYFDGKYFVDENVILVAINYRLGPLGFINFGDDEISPNIGLKDQVLALKWVKKNIAAFGGSPEKVTLGGCSAGAAQVQHHILSKQSKDLFRGAVSSSGSAISFWAMHNNPREDAVKFASYLNCPIPETATSSTKETVACLKAKPVEELVPAQIKLRKWLGYPLGMFGPSIEKDSEDSFISEHPEKVLQSGNFNKVSYMTGITDEDGAMLDLQFYHDQTLLDELDNNWEKRAPVIFGYDEMPSSERDKVSKKLYDAYFGDLPIGELTWTSLRNLFTDRFFGEPCEASVRYHSQYAPVYSYVFRFTGDYSISHRLYGLTGDQGIAHGDDLQYLFPGGGVVGSPDYSGDTPAEIVEFSKKFVKLWSSFIHETAPTATWGPQENWKPVVKLGEKSSVPFYEIAIETGTWKEDYQSRVDILQDIFPRLKVLKSKEKLEL